MGIFSKQAVTTPAPVAKSYADPVKKTGSEFEVDNWVISEFILDKLVPVVGYHPYPLTEQALIVSAFTYFKPQFVYEWGTHIGKAARIFYEASKAFNINSEINSIDLPEDVDHVEHPHETRGMLVKEFAEVKLHLGDGVNTALELYKQSGGQGSALFFVDGDHSYETVVRELTSIFSTVENPIVLAHDTFFQSADSNYNVGPFNAVNDVIAKLNLKVNRISTNTGLPGMTLLYKINA